MKAIVLPGCDTTGRICNATKLEVIARILTHVTVPEPDGVREHRLGVRTRAS